MHLYSTGKETIEYLELRYIGLNKPLMHALLALGCMDSEDACDPFRTVKRISIDTDEGSHRSKRFRS